MNIKVGYAGFFYTMICIYSTHITPRLTYCCNFIFKEQWGIEFRITDNKDEIGDTAHPVLNYSADHIEKAFYRIVPHPLLFEKNITAQSVDCFRNKDYVAFFRTTDADFPFDVLAATFYLLSRYEEYCPHKKDLYGRFSHENSIAFKQGFLNQPLVNIWLKDFASSLKEKNNRLTFKPQRFEFLPTYDIDIAWSYRNKGWLRNIGGFMKKPSLERIKVLTGLTKDPFDAYDFLDSLHHHRQLKPIYFFPVAKKTSRYDKNISPFKKAMAALIKKHASSYDIGLHPSWRSHLNDFELSEEKNLLEEISARAVSQSRQHYIKFNLPETFERLLDAGIKKEYSMGYGSINGFRASVASSFYWYNLKKEISTDLRLYPFCFMDANSHYEQRQSAASSYDELMYYYQECKKVDGLFITVFHNNFLGTDRTFKGWRDLYEKFTAQVQQ